MPNSIALAQKFMPVLDEAFKAASVTADMDSPTRDNEHLGANEIQVYKMSVVGLGDYDKASGYPAGAVTGLWETLTLSHDRGREFNIDREDNEESLGLAFGRLSGEFIRQHVAPEVDAVRFAAWASAVGIQTVAGATLDASTILPAIDAASLALDEAEVPEDGRRLYISSTCNRFLRAAISRSLGNESAADRRLKTLDEMRIIPVPQSRFYTALTLDPGAADNEGGFIKNAVSGKDINFMLLHESAVWQATKLARLKIFLADENQDLDANKFQYRIYHDGDVYEEKVLGVYLHKKA